MNNIVVFLKIFQVVLSLGSRLWKKLFKKL
uniref:Uncharacterized protein n=1 Tax=Rhizophora mucronata TaxID=61149 RepID=A0A2P2QHN7_RHIMU